MYKYVSVIVVIILKVTDSTLQHTSTQYPATCKDSLNDMKWLPITETVKSTYGQIAHLVWKYTSSLPAATIHIKRGHVNTDEYEAMGEWSLGDGFVADVFLNTDLQFHKSSIDGEDGEQIVIDIRNDVRTDLDLVYYCSVIFSDGCSFMKKIVLKSERPEWTYANKSVHAKVGENARFIWEYRYPFFSHIIMFRQRNQTSGKVIQALGYWDSGHFNLEPNYTHRLFSNASILKDKTGEHIELDLLLTTESDFGFMYDCEVHFTDGLDLISKTKLELTQDDQTTSKPDVTITVTDKYDSSQHDDSTTITAIIVPVTMVTIIVVIIFIVILKRRNKRHRRQNRDSVAATSEVHRCNEEDAISIQFNYDDPISAVTPLNTAKG